MSKTKQNIILVSAGLLAVVVAGLGMAVKPIMAAYMPPTQYSCTNYKNGVEVKELKTNYLYRYYNKCVRPSPTDPNTYPLEKYYCLPTTVYDGNVGLKTVNCAAGCYNGYCK